MMKAAKVDTEEVQGGTIYTSGRGDKKQGGAPRRGHRDDGNEIRWQ